ncbi:MAG: NAD-dependent deacylase [Verrucomicrobiota bacterium]
MSTANPSIPYNHIVILTGAGVSAESGIPTFRGTDGLWEGRDVTELATPQAFRAQPHVVQKFYNERRQMLLDKQPNAAHEAIARLQKNYKGRVTLITQNIDDLHERGGSAEVWHIHGELLKSRCVKCAAVTDCRQDLDDSSVCPECHAAGSLRPHVVWFGETPLFLDELSDRTSDASLFVAIGTSGLVYPAANFVHIARSRGAECVEFNLESSEVFDHFIEGPATHTVTHWVDWLLSEKQP